MREARRFLNYAEIARRLLIGQKTEEIADEMGLTPAWIRHVTGTDAFMISLRKLEERVWKEFDSATRRDGADLRTRMQDDANSAYDDLREIMFGSSNERLRATLLTDHLERLGHGAIKQVRVQGEIQPSQELVDLIGSTIQHIEEARNQDVVGPSPDQRALPPASTSDVASGGPERGPASEVESILVLPGEGSARIH